MTVKSRSFFRAPPIGERLQIRAGIFLTRLYEPHTRVSSVAAAPLCLVSSAVESPPSQGGVAAPLGNVAKPPQRAQTGWLKNLPIINGEQTTPSAPPKVASRLYS